MTDARSDKKRSNKFYLSPGIILVDDWLLYSNASTAENIAPELTKSIRLALKGTLDSEDPLVRELLVSGILRKDTPVLSWKREYLNVYFELTLECNLKCEYCFNRNFVRGQSLSIGDWKRVSNRLPSNSHVTLFGGEPTLMPGIGDLINHNNSLGIPITLFSNCLCLEESLIEILKRYNGNCVKTSLDGPQLINDSVRGNGVYKQVCATIMQLAENGVPVVVKVLKTKQLMGNVRELVLALQNIGVREIGFGDIIVHRDSPQSEVDRVLVDMDLELYWEIREAMKSSSIRLLDSIDYKDPLVNMCGCGDNLVYIRSDGAISGCTVLSDIYFRHPQQHRSGNENQWDLSLPREFSTVGSLAPICRECELLNLCLGGCRGRAFLENGSITACDSFRQEKITTFVRKTLAQRTSEIQD